MPRQFIRFASACLLVFACPHFSLAAEEAWDVGLDLTVEGASAVTGESQHHQALHGLALVHANWKQVDAPANGLNHSGYISALALAGEGPTGRFLGDFLTASNMEGYESARLYSWWFETSRKDWSLRAGALLADEEFAGTEVGGNFFNAAFGWPAFISANTVNTGPAFYIAGLGLRFERKWGESAAWRFGIYDGDTFDSPTGDPTINPHGLHFKLGGGQGWFLITEAALTPIGRASRVKVGGWFHTATFEDMRDDDAGNPIAISGNSPRKYGENFGGFAAIEHSLTGESGKAGNVEFFVRAGISPSNRNTIGWALDTGLSWIGPIPSRPEDVFAVGFTHAEFSSRFSDNARLTDPSAAVLNFERVIEATYSVKISDHFSVQPDLQFINHLGGTTAQRDTLVFLFRINASY